MQPSYHKHYLVITALGQDRPGIINILTSQISQCGCNIEDSRFALLGENFTFIMLLSGSWDAITQSELMLPRLGSELDLLIVMKKTTAIDRLPIATTIRIQVDVPDSPGLIKRFTDLFASKETNISELVSKTNFDKITEQATLHIIMAVQTGKDVNLAVIKQHFDELCRELNGRGTMNITDHLTQNDIHGENT